MVNELFPTINDSPVNSISFPTRSTGQSVRLNRLFVHNEKIRLEHKCEICSHEFFAVAELIAHQQQGCEGLIDIDPIAMDCKPTAIDFTNSECESQMEDNYNGTNVIDEQTTGTKEKKRKRPRNVAKSSESKKISDKLQPLDKKALKKVPLKCQLCDKLYVNFHLKFKIIPYLPNPLLDLLSFHTACRFPRSNITNFSNHLVAHALRSNGGESQHFKLIFPYVMSLI